MEVYMRNNNTIQLSKEKKEEMISSIKNYFLEERGEELGDLASSLILRFIIEELALEFYNQGVYDSYKYMNDRIEDLLSIQKY
ncbi:hypothetical protein CKR_2401 [Clostridium kluyveri NBRC 12016]|nr:hypothetical protein CKR_2401 [Clostridium kluyveri NBRC 12016]